jgi:hypothetical protein
MNIASYQLSILIRISMLVKIVKLYIHLLKNKTSRKKSLKNPRKFPNSRNLVHYFWSDTPLEIIHDIASQAISLRRWCRDAMTMCW